MARFDCVSVRDAPIRYSVLVSALILAFSAGSGIGQTRPIQIHYSAYTILCYCYAPQKAKKPIIKHQKVLVHYIPSVLKTFHSLMWAGLAKSLARRPGAIVFSSRATKMYHRPARRATLNTGLPRKHFYNRSRAEEIMCRSHAKISLESHLIECQ